MVWRGRAATGSSLSEADRLELARLGRAALTLPFRVVQRARLILYAADGMIDKEIAVRCDCHPAAWRPSGDDGSASRASRGLRTGRARVARAVFPPEQVAEVDAVACELPARHDRPLGRFSRAELHRLVIEHGVTDASASTIWRWLHDDALKPWQQRSWIFPRDPDFQRKAGRVLDLYAAPLRGPAAAPRRVRHLRRREVPAAGARRAATRRVAARAGTPPAGRVRLPARRHAGLPGRLGRPPRQPVRPLSSPRPGSSRSAASSSRS